MPSEGSEVPGIQCWIGPLCIKISLDYIMPIYMPPFNSFPFPFHYEWEHSRTHFCGCAHTSKVTKELWEIRMWLQKGWIKVVLLNVINNGTEMTSGASIWLVHYLAKLPFSSEHENLHVSMIHNTRTCQTREESFKENTTRQNPQNPNSDISFLLSMVCIC